MVLWLVWSLRGINVSPPTVLFSCCGYIPSSREMLIKLRNLKKLTNISINMFWQILAKREFQQFKMAANPVIRVGSTKYHPVYLYTYNAYCWLWWGYDSSPMGKRLKRKKKRRPFFNYSRDDRSCNWTNSATEKSTQGGVVTILLAYTKKIILGKPFRTFASERNTFIIIVCLFD